MSQSNKLQHGSIVEFEIQDAVNLDIDSDDDFYDDESYDHDLDKKEAQCLIGLVQASFEQPSPVEKKQDRISKEGILVGPTTTILDEEAIRKSKKRRKKLLKKLKQ